MQRNELTDGDDFPYSTFDFLMPHNSPSPWAPRTLEDHKEEEEETTLLDLTSRKLVPAKPLQQVPRVSQNLSAVPPPAQTSSPTPEGSVPALAQLVVGKTDQQEAVPMKRPHNGTVEEDQSKKTKVGNDNDQIDEESKKPTTSTQSSSASLEFESVVEKSNLEQQEPTEADDCPYSTFDFLLPHNSASPWSSLTPEDHQEEEEGGGEPTLLDLDLRTLVSAKPLCFLAQVPLAPAPSIEEVEMIQVPPPAQAPSPTPEASETVRPEPKAAKSKSSYFNLDTKTVDLAESRIIPMNHKNTETEDFDQDRSGEGSAGVDHYFDNGNEADSSMNSKDSEMIVLQDDDASNVVQFPAASSPVPVDLLQGPLSPASSIEDVEIEEGVHDRAIEDMDFGFNDVDDDVDPTPFASTLQVPPPAQTSSPTPGASSPAASQQVVGRTGQQESASMKRPRGTAKKDQTKRAEIGNDQAVDEESNEPSTSGQACSTSSRSRPARKSTSSSAKTGIASAGPGPVSRVSARLSQQSSSRSAPIPSDDDDDDEELKNQPSTSGSQRRDPDLIQTRSRSPSPAPVEDQDAQDEFADLPLALPREENHCTPHPTRDNKGGCIYCKQTDSPHARSFENLLRKSFMDKEKKGNLKKKFPRKKLLKKLPDGLGNRKIRCGHTVEGDPTTQCDYQFHVACVMEARPVAQYNPQYYALVYHFGKLVCHDHVCQLCHTDKKMRSARTGTLLKVGSQLRSFHEECRPVGSSLLPDGSLKLQHIVKDMKYQGPHCPACSVCGEKKRNVKKCENCVQTFHPRCNTWTREGLCRRCTLDEQIEYGKPVLVENEGFFRIGECIPWDDVQRDATIRKETNFGKENFAAVRLANAGKMIIKELRDLQRVPTIIAYETYLTISGSYKAMNRATKDVELEALKTTLKRRSEEYELGPGPEIRTKQKFHRSLFRNQEYSHAMEELAKVHEVIETHKGIYIDVIPGKGRGVRARQEIPKNTILVEYIGEVLSKEEKEKRMNLLNESKDLQALYYMYFTKMHVTRNDPDDEERDEEITEHEVGIDAAVHHNHSGIFNSSCEPNCVTSRGEDDDDYFTVVGDVKFQKLLIITAKAIDAGEELTIDYHWKELACLCGSTKCRNPAKPQKW